MNFAEIRFWILLLSALSVALTGRMAIVMLRPELSTAYDKFAILGLGLFLLMQVSMVTFTIFLTVAVGTYVALVFAQRLPETIRPYTLWIIIPVQIVPLLYYKYAGFLHREFWGGELDYFRDLLIPVGISFYTFQKVAFAIDTLTHRQKLPIFLDYLNFAAFFPQIVAGPIERRDDLLPQMQGFRFRWQPEEIADGVSYIVLGLFLKCCLADNFAGIASSNSSLNPFDIWIANTIFGLRIYYDFSGYSLIALGLARCIGIKLSLNFSSPYCSTNVTEFWRRWHVTLSQWFRDYVYVPLGGGRVNWWPLNVAIVFLLSGVWHGAGWNFVLWGGLHGLALIMHRVFSRRIRLPRAAGWLVTMGFVSVTWLCFYETRNVVLFEKLHTLFSPQEYTLGALKSTASHWSGAQGLILLSLLVLATISLGLEWLSLKQQREPYWHLRRPALLVLLVIVTVLLAPTENNGFIYFAF